jgi:hypothetical protein
VPRFENDARASVDVVAPTVIASETREGEPLQAFALSLPAATAYATPSAIELRTAVSSADDAPPPRLMLAVAGCPATWLEVTKSIPAMTPELVPEPLQFSTRTATIWTCLATP